MFLDCGGVFCFRLDSLLLVVPGKDTKAEVSPASLVALVPEEKVSFSLCALSVSTLTVAKIRKVYNKLDSKAIAKQVRYAYILLWCWPTLSFESFLVSEGV